VGSSSPLLSRLEIFPTRLATKIGENVEPQITARDLAGADVSVTPAYSSSNPAAVFVDGGGAIHARGVGTATLQATAGGQTAEMVVHVGSNTFDLNAPSSRVLSANYIDLSKIARVSRFRSTVGHTYGQEPCRSMKHYFQPKSSVDWTSVDIYAPAAGTIWLIATDGWGYRLMLRPRDLAAVDVVMFHVSPDPGIVRGSWVEAGAHIGRHATSATMSDISIEVGDYQTGMLHSYFDVMTDALFAEFQARGVASRQAAIITKAERDADPISCADERQFTQQGTLPDWLELN
jgi:hypothetical protein